MHRLVALASLLPVLVACASSTVINSRPAGAKLFLNGEPVGVTPYTMSDTKIVGSTTKVRLEAPGYQPLEAAISRNEELDVGALIAGIFLLVPFLWIEGYKATHDYELQPGGVRSPAPVRPDRPTIFPE